MAAEAQEQVSLLRWRIEALEEQLREARDEALRWRGEAATAQQREAAFARRIAELEGRLADARREAAVLADRAACAEAARLRLERSGVAAAGETEVASAWERRLEVERERTRQAARALAEARARIERLERSRERFFAKLLEWQQLIEGDARDQIELAEFIAQLREEVVALAAKKEDAEAREGRLREVVAALGLDPALALAGDPDETISLDEAAVEGGAQTPAAGSEPMASAPGAQRTERGGTAPFAGAHPAEAVEAALAEQARMAEARRALEALDETRRAQALERVDDLLSGSPTLRHAAIQSLVRLAGPAATPLFSAALSWIHDPEERSALLRAVGEAGGEGALETLEAALRDENPRLRAAAAEALACLDDPRSLGLLVALLGDPAATVRRRAALAVAASGRPEAPELMARAARDEDPQLRRIACTALGTLDHPLARRALLTALNDRRLEVRRAAAAALGRQLGRDLSHLPDLPEAERRRAVTALRDRGAQEKRSGPAEDSSAQPSPSSEAPTDLRPNPSPASNPEPRRQPASTRPAGEEGVRGSSAPGFEAVRRALEISLRPLSLDELHAAVGGERGALAVLVQQRLAAGELMRRGHKFSLP